jgi:hypothetical protein
MDGQQGGRRRAAVRMMKKGVRREAEGGNKKLRVKNSMLNFMVNFMNMKISCNVEWPEYFSSEFLLPPPPAFRL